MLKLGNLYETHYDSETKTWSGRKWRRFYNNELSFGQIAFEEMRRRLHKICQISDSEGTQLTNEEVLLQAIKIVKYFESEGIKQSDIIGIVARNTTYLFGVLLACFFHGCAYHAVHIGRDKYFTKDILSVTKPKLLFFDGQDYEKIQFAVKDLSPKLITLSNHMDEITSVLDLLSLTPSEECNGYEPADLENGPDQTLLILCTSGTTSTPKAVKIPNTMKIYETINFLTADDVQCVPSTMDWISGFMSLTGTIIYGAMRIITDKPWTPEYCVELFRKYKATFSFLSSAQVALIVKRTSTTAEDLSSLRNIICGGSVCPTLILNQMRSLLKNGRFLYAYSFTESYDGFCSNMEESRPDSVGRLARGFNVRIVNDDGVALGPNEIGELWVKHPFKWIGYYGDEEASRNMMDKNGWIHTGDVGYFDEDGFLFLQGRKKELLKYYSEHYYPSHIEEIIARMPEIKEACVFGVSDEIAGDLPAAAVVPVNGASITAQDVIDFVKLNVEAEYKKLHGGAIILSELPKTGSGKVDRNAAKQIFLENNK